MFHSAIGIFDSGVGGLTVLKAVQKVLPYEDIVYFADTARMPYGAKSAEQIVSYSRQILRWMMEEQQVKLVIVACNTSSALAIEAVSGEFDLPIVDTIRPLVSMMATQLPNRKVLVLATEATAKSGAFENAFHIAGYSGIINSIGCPQFVPLIETGQASSVLALNVAREYLSAPQAEHVEVVVHGCTHYPWMEDTLRAVLPPHVIFVDPANAMAQEAWSYLHTHHLASTSDQEGRVTYYTSGVPEHFTGQVQHLLGINAPLVKKQNFDVMG
ncbi:MAG: glutamate racemase [Proteobacteria bacterium]|nr:glutamate racemase [Pseudomonadota bacterium]